MLSGSVVDDLLFNVLPIGGSVFVFVLVALLSNHLEEEESELVALLSLSYECLVTVSVTCLFLTVPWAGLQCVIVVFPYHAHFLVKLKHVL